VPRLVATVRVHGQSSVCEQSDARSQEHQADAFEQCWRKDWQDKEPRLLPAKHLSAWIQANLYLNLADAPFDREDTTLNPAAGACLTCPRRSGYNTSRFADVQGDKCFDASCFHLKITAHIDREVAVRPQLIQIETTWRSPKKQRPSVTQPASDKLLHNARDEKMASGSEDSRCLGRSKLI
jgi:hypothetical protein